MITPKQTIKRFAGLDLGKDSIYGCIVDETGFKIEDRFTMMLQSLYELRDWLQRFQVVAVVMESTGVYTEPVKAVLAPVMKIEVVNAADTKRANRKKTDPDDAWWISELLRNGTIGKGKIIESSYCPPEKQAELRLLTRKQARMTEDATTCKNRITKTFARINVKLPDVFSNKKFTQTAMGIYEAFALGLSWDEFLTQLKDQQAALNGQDRARITRQITFVTKHRTKLKDAVANATVPTLSRAIALTLLMDLQEQKLREQCLQTLATEIAQLGQADQIYQEDLAILRSIPGIGETTGPQILTESPPADYFPASNKFASFCGLVPKVSKSAEVTYIGRITKRGSPYLRRALYQAAQVAAMNPATRFGKKFQRLYKRKGKGKGKACWVAVARMMAEIIWVLLSRREFYSEASFVKKKWNLKRTARKKQSLQEIVDELASRGYTVTLDQTHKEMKLTSL